MLLSTLHLLLLTFILTQTAKFLPRTRLKRDGLVRKRSTTALSRSRKAQKRHLATLALLVIAIRADPVFALLRRLVPFYSTFALSALVLAYLPIRDQLAESIFRYFGETVFRPRESAIDEAIEIATLITTSVQSTSRRVVVASSSSRVKPLYKAWFPAKPVSTVDVQLDTAPTSASRQLVEPIRARNRRSVTIDPNASVMYPGALLLTPYPPSRVMSTATRSSPRLQQAPFEVEAVVNTDEGPDLLLRPALASVESNHAVSAARSPRVVKKQRPSALGTEKKTRSSINAANVRSPRKRVISQTRISRLPRPVDKKSSRLRVDDGSALKRSAEVLEEDDVPASKKARRT